MDTFGLKLIALSGGVGGAKLASGLSRVLPSWNLMIVANTGDDFDHFGLRICPDIDTILYTSSGRNDWRRGWGRVNETWNFMDALEELGEPTWFRLGDKDLAIHVARTAHLRDGKSLSEVTRFLAGQFGLSSWIVPMSDDPVHTYVGTDAGDLSFQHYFVKLQSEPRLRSIRYEGADAARPAAAFLTALNEPSLEAIVICPSNPVLSIDPILAVDGMRQALLSSKVPIVAVSPVRNGAAFKGPTIRNLVDLGHEPTSLGVARHYAGLIDGWVLDEADADIAIEVERLGISPLVLNTAMGSVEDCDRLARDVLTFVKGMKVRRRSGPTER